MWIFVSLKKCSGLVEGMTIYLKIGTNWQNQQCCLASSSKMAPRILISSIAMRADHSFYVKFIPIFALTFFEYILFQS